MKEYKTHFCLQGIPIFLYPFTYSECCSEEYLKWMNDPAITKTLGRFDYLMPVNRKKLIKYYREINVENTIFFAIYHSEDSLHKNEQQFIGTLKIMDIDFIAKRASIGVMIGDKAKWGKGFATKAIEIASSYIFNNLGFRKITAGYIARNIGMEKAFLKNGFEIEAIFKEQLFFEGEFIDHIFVCKFRDHKKKS